MAYVQEWNNLVIAMRGLTDPTKILHFRPPQTLKPVLEYVHARSL